MPDEEVANPIVLVVEDNLTLADELAISLRHHGMQPIVVADWDNALERVSAGGLDIIVLDQRLGSVDALLGLPRLRVLTQVPILVMNASQHFFYVNSAAYAAAGITVDTPNPQGGDFGIRNGKLTGIVGEAAAMSAFIKVMPPITPEVIATAITDIAAMAAKVGVTYVHEAATGALAGVREIDLLHQVFGQPGFAVRGSMSLWSPAPAMTGCGRRPSSGCPTDPTRATPASCGRTTSVATPAARRTSPRSNWRRTSPRPCRPAGRSCATPTAMPPWTW